MTKYAWPLTGEGNTALELMASESAIGIPGIARFSAQARRDAVLAELLAARVPTFNVKSFGAKGDGTTDDGPAINAAIAAAPAGSKIYFPLSDNPSAGLFHLYNITQTITLTKPVILVSDFFSLGGAGSGPWIVGSVNGPLVSFATSGIRQGCGIIGLGLQQTNAGASASLVDAINLGAPAVFHRIYGDTTGHGIRLLSNTFSVSVSDCDIEGHLGSNSVGIYASGHTKIDTCSTVGFHAGFRVSGGFSTIINPRAEVNQIGYEIGVNESGVDTIAQGIAILGGSGEANDTQILVTHASGLLVSGMRTLSTTNAPSGTGVYGLKIDGCQGSVFEALTIAGSNCTNGGVQINVGPFRAFVTLSAVQSVVPTPWSVDVAGGVSGVSFINCNVDQLVRTLTSAGTTPDTGMSTVGGPQPCPLDLNYGADITITDFLNGLAGVPLILQSVNAASHITIQHGTNIFLKSGANHLLASKETLTLMKFAAGGPWYEI